MLNYQEIFNIQATTLPISKKELSNVLSKKSFMGYVQCPYNRLVNTLKEICQAEQYQISINPNELYSNANNPFHHADCVIQVEGIRSFDEFVDRIVSNEETKEWTDFLTYSETFRDEVKNMKTAVIKKYLWNVQNINSWFSENGVSIPYNRKDELISNFDEFKNTVLTSGDLSGFINSCDEGELKNAAKVLSYNIIKILQKYRPELDKHVLNNTRRESAIIVKNPIINRIFVVSNFAKQCEKDWPKIKFTALDRRSFEGLSLWNEER